MPTENTYKDFAEWEQELVRTTARSMVGKLGVRRNDVPDLMQDLMCFLWQKKGKYDPEHAGGAGYKTFISRAIKRRKIDIFRALGAKKRRLDWQAHFLDEHRADLFDEAFDGAKFAPVEEAFWTTMGSYPQGDFEDWVLAKVTLQEGKKRMTPRQRRIFGLCEDGYSPVEIAEKLGISKGAVYEHFSGIARRLKEAGFFDEP